MATPLAEWLFDEATSGDAPTSVADSQASPVNLAKTTGSSAGAWTTIGAGAGYDFAAAAGNTRWAVSTSGNKLQLTNKQKIGCQIVFRHENANAALATLFGVPDSFGGGAPFYIRYTGSGGDIRLYFNDTLVRTFSGLSDGTVYVLTIAIDTTQATANDRIKAWVNTSTAGSVNANPTQNANMTTWNGGVFGIGGHPDGAQFNGAIFYAALYVDGEVDALAAEATTLATALLADNDASPSSGALAVISRSPADDATAISPSTDTLSLTFNGDIQAGTGDIVLKTSGGSTVETIPIGDAQVDITGAVLTVTLTDPLGPGSFYVEIANTCIEPDGGGDAWEGFSGAAAWNFTAFVQQRAPYRLGGQINPITEPSGVVGSSDELKAGISSILRTVGKPGAPGRYTAFHEIIADDDAGLDDTVTMARLSGRTPQELTYDPAIADPDVGPSAIWSAGTNNERATPCVVPRWDGVAGYICIVHEGNNSGPRQLGAMRSTDGWVGQAWEVVGTYPLVAVGSGGSWNDVRMADGNLIRFDDGEVVVLARGSDGAATHTGRWTHASGDLTALSADAGNPVIASGDGGSWTSSGTGEPGAVPGQPWLSPDGVLWMLVSAGAPGQGCGRAYSFDRGETWTLVATADLTPTGTETSIADGVSALPDGDQLVSTVGTDITGVGEGRKLLVAPIAQELGTITKLAKNYYPSGQPFTTVAPTGGGLCAQDDWILAGRFRAFNTYTAGTNQYRELYTEELSDEILAYVRINGEAAATNAGKLEAYIRSTDDEITLRSTARVDTGLWVRFAVVRRSTSVFELWHDDGLGGPLQLVASSSTPTLATTAAATVAAVGNWSTAATINGANEPFLGTISDLVICTGTPPTGTVETINAILCLLQETRTAFSGGSVALDFPTSGTDTGAVDLVEGQAPDEVQVLAVATGSSASAGAAATCSLTIEDSADRPGRKVAFLVTFEGADSASVAVTFNSSSTGITLATPSNIVSGAGSAIYYLDDADLPAGGTYTVSADAPGASALTQVTAVYLNAKQGAPADSDSASGTGTTLGTSLSAPSPGCLALDCGYSASDTDDCAPSATGQLELSDFGTGTAAHRHFTSALLSLSTETLAPAWGSLADTEQHILASAVWEPFDPNSTEITVSPGIGQETDAALAGTLAKQLPAGVASEADSSQALALSRQVATGLAAEADTAASATLTKSLSVGVATEADSAQAITLSRGVATGQASETDAAQATSLAKAAAAGVATETDSAHGPLLARRPAVETDVALAPSAFSRLLPAGVAVETDAAVARALAKHLASGAATETDAAQAPALTSGFAAGAAVETDVALAAEFSKQLSAGVATETDAALPLDLTSGLTTGAATETDSALARTFAKGIAAPGVSTESDSAADGALQKNLAALPSVETAVALALTLSRVLAAGASLETDAALAPRFPLATEAANEADTALALTLSGTLPTVAPTTGAWTKAATPGTGIWTKAATPGTGAWTKH